MKVMGYCEFVRLLTFHVSSVIGRMWVSEMNWNNTEYLVYTWIGILRVSERERGKVSIHN